MPSKLQKPSINLLHLCNEWGPLPSSSPTRVMEGLRAGWVSHEPDGRGAAFELAMGHLGPWFKRVVLYRDFIMYVGS